MTALLMITSALCVVLIAMCGWLFGKVRIQQFDIEKLYDSVAQLAQDQAKLRKGMGDISAKVDEAALTQEEAADHIAKQIEKKWDDGLQSMLAWSPFDESEVK